MTEQTPKHRSRAKQLLIVLALALAGFALMVGSVTGKGVFANIIGNMDNAIFNHFAATRLKIADPPVNGSSDIVVVAIDDRTLATLGAYSPDTYRTYHIQALEHITRASVAAVVYDILFVDPHPDPQVDIRFAQAMKAAPVYAPQLATSVAQAGMAFAPLDLPSLNFADKSPIEENGFAPVPRPIFEALAGMGAANAYPDIDGVLRKIPIVLSVEGKAYPALSLELFLDFNGVDRKSVRLEGNRIKADSLSLSVDQNMRVRIPVFGGNSGIRFVSFYDVYAARIPPGFFEGKIVFIAATAPGLGDNKLLPVVGYVPGVRVHTDLLLGLFQDSLIRELPEKTYIAFLLFIALLYTISFYNKKKLSLLARMVDYFQTDETDIITRFLEWLGQFSVFRRIAQWWRQRVAGNYAVRFGSTVFKRARKRVEGVLLQLFLVYLALFAIFYFANLYIRPTTILVQIFLAYIMVAEFKSVDQLLAEDKTGQPESSGQIDNLDE